MDELNLIQDGDGFILRAESGELRLTQQEALDLSQSGPAIRALVLRSAHREEAHAHVVSYVAHHLVWVDSLAEHLLLSIQTSAGGDVTFAFSRDQVPVLISQLETEFPKISNPSGPLQ